MKNKVIILLIIFLSIGYFSTVHAVDLKFEASLNADKTYYVFYTSVKASSHSYRVFEKAAQERGANPIEAREKLYITPESIRADGRYVGSNSHYDVTGLLIHKLGPNGQHEKTLKKNTSYMNTIRKLS